MLATGVKNAQALTYVLRKIVKGLDKSRPGIERRYVCSWFMANPS